MRKYIAEFIGTFTLVLFGCGIAVVSGGNLVATSLAFGLAIVAPFLGAALAAFIFKFLNVKKYYLLNNH